MLLNYDPTPYVTAGEGEPEAVLIRALELEDPHDRAAAGPGKLCRHLGLTREDSGLLLEGPRIWICESDHRPLVIASAERVGVDYAGDAAFWPLRFFDEGSAAVSRR